MFVQGQHHVAEKRLKRAYGLTLERFESRIERELGPGDELDAVRPLAAKLAFRSAKSREDRQLRDRVREMGPDDSYRSVRSLLEDFYLELLLVIWTGRPRSHQGMHELLEGVGVAAMTKERLSGAPPVPSLPIPEIISLARERTLGGIVRRVNRASYAELELARDDMLSFAAFARVFTPFATKVFGVREAIGFRSIADMNDLNIALALPGMLVLRERLAAEMTDTRICSRPKRRAFARFAICLSGSQRSSRGSETPWRHTSSATMSAQCLRPPSIASRSRNRIALSW